MLLVLASNKISRTSPDCNAWACCFRKLEGQLIQACSSFLLGIPALHAACGPLVLSCTSVSHSVPASSLPGISYCPPGIPFMSKVFLTHKKSLHQCLLNLWGTNINYSANSNIFLASQTSWECSF